jgi:hypothetical protein
VRERLRRVGAHDGVREGPDEPADAEHRDLHAEPRERLPELEADDAGAEHRDGAR